MFLVTLKVFLVCLLSMSVNSYASSLKAPFSVETASVIPKGVRNVRYLGLYTSPTEKFDNNGQTVPLGNAFNTSINMQKLIDSKNTEAEKAAFRAYLSGKGLSTDPGETVGQTTGEVNVAVQVMLPVFAFGITEKLTTAIAIPIVNSKTSVDTGFVSASSIRAFQEALIASNNPEEEKDLRNNINNAIAKKNNDYGYDPLVGEEKTELGDIKLINKYLLHKRRRLRVSLKNEITLPTGKDISVNKVVDIPSGDGQLDVGFGVIFDIEPAMYLGLTVDFGYVAQLSDRTAKRVPEVSTSTLTPDIDPSVSRDLGDQVYFNFAVKPNISKGLNAHVTYGLQYKERDKYSGTKYSSERYGWMSQDTEQQMHSLRTGLTYSTVPLFKEKKFVAPLEVKLNYTRVFDGKNVTKNPLTSFELVMYF